MVPKATTVPPATISLIWMILYPIILIVFGFVFVQAFRANVRWKIASPFAINLVANLLLMPIFAGLCNVQLAAVDILIVWATTLWCVTSAWTADKWVAVAQAPYFVRVPVHDELTVGRGCPAQAGRGWPGPGQAIARAGPVPSDARPHCPHHQSAPRMSPLLGVIAACHVVLEIPTATVRALPSYIETFIYF